MYDRSRYVTWFRTNYYSAPGYPARHPYYGPRMPGPQRPPFNQHQQGMPGQQHPGSNGSPMMPQPNSAAGPGFGYSRPAPGWVMVYVVALYANLIVLSCDKKQALHWLKLFKSVWVNCNCSKYSSIWQGNEILQVCQTICYYRLGWKAILCKWGSVN